MSCNNIKKLHYFVHELHLHKNKQTSRRFLKNKKTTTTTNQKTPPTSPSAVICIRFIMVTQKVLLVASDHSFRTDGDQVGGKPICRR